MYVNRYLYTCAYMLLYIYTYVHIVGLYDAHFQEGPSLNVRLEARLLARARGMEVPRGSFLGNFLLSA